MNEALSAGRLIASPMNQHVVNQRAPLPCPCGSAYASRVNLANGLDLLQCQRCGLLVRAQMPPEEILAARYREEYWADYGEEQLGSARDNVHAHAWAWVKKLRPDPGLLVDVGCGSGAMLALCQKQNWKGIGFDLSTQAVAYARARGLEAYAHPWPPCILADETADAVTFINVLDHLRDPFGALREAWRILRPAGLLYIRVPNGPVHARLISLLSAVRLSYLPVVHLFGFGPTALLHHLPRLGFAVVAVRTAPPSRVSPYGQTSSWRSACSSFLKKADRVAYRVLAGLGLDRRGWGLSLEVMAYKVHLRTEG